MLKGYNIIYFGVEQWDGLMRPRQQLLSVFARHNKVLFVEGQLHLRRTVAGFRQGELASADFFHQPVRQAAENLFIFRYPVWAPISGRFPFNQLSGAIRRAVLQRVLAKLQLTEPIVWFLKPGMLNLFDDLPSARLFLYHIEDEYTSYGNMSPERRRRTEELEKKMMARADSVIVVSKTLYEAKKPFNPHTYLVPNGVNYWTYAQALEDPHLPYELQNIPGPRLGYSGNISDKLELDMLADMMQAHPEWSLVFLGQLNIEQKTAAWRALQALPNVYHIGPVAWSSVPHYVKGFDVGLMPYVQDLHAQTISPMKLYDYLAAGLPIASLDFPAARDFSHYLHIAETPAEFSQAVRGALADTGPERHQTRRNVAAQNSWESRVEQLSDLIEERLSTGAEKAEIGLGK